MADPIRRLQSGNVQVAGISSLPQPNMNFGTQRQDIAYQAAADASSSLGKVISNLSASMFERAGRLSEEAALEFVMENPPDLAQLDAMSKGDPNAFKRNFSLNPYQASIQKFRAIELSAHAEVELVNKANQVQLRIETGKDEQGNEYEVSTKKVAEDFQAMIAGWSSALAGVSPDAAYKFKATAATHANRLLVSASKKESAIALAKNKVKIASEVGNFPNTVAKIIEGSTADGIPINELIQAEKSRIVANAITLAGAEAGNFALEQLGTIETDIKMSVLENAVVSRMDGLGGDMVSLNARIRDRSLPPDLQRVWDSMSIADQKKARDKMVKQFEQLVEIKNKDRDVRKVDLTSEANSATMTYLDMGSTEDEKAAALNTLMRISNMDSSVVSAKFLQIDLPALLKKDVEDDFESVAKLRDKLANKDPNLATTESIINYARANRITPKTALTLAGEFLPKDAGLFQRKVNAQSIEYQIRIGKIKTPEQLQTMLSLAGLTMADAPDNWPALMTAKPEPPEDDPMAVNALVDQVDSGAITTAVGVATAAKGKRIKGETIISLGKRVGDRKLQIDNRVKSGASDIADASGVRNPQNRARIERDLEAEITTEFENQKVEFQNGKRKTPPNINEARRSVEGKFLNEEDQKKLDKTKSDLKSAYGRGGTSLPKKAVEQNIDLVSIPPSFEPGAAVKVTPNYRRRLVDELAKTKASQGEIDAIVESIVRSQESIETMERRRRAAGGR